MKRLTTLLVATAALAAACGERTVTTPGTATTSALTPAKPSHDEIPNNLDASVDAVAEVMSLNVGGANGTTQLYVVPTGGDGKPGCNLTGSTTLVLAVSSSNPAAATVGPASVTFASCGDTKTLTVTPVAVGSTTISVSQASNNTGGTFNLAPATFTVNVAPPANTAPTVTVAGVTGGSSYPKGSVPAATCQVTDTEDGNSSFAATLSAVSGPNAVDGIGSQTASCSYTDAGGLTATASATYNIVDAAAPAISYLLNPDPADGLNGWHRSNVTLTWTVTGTSLVKTGCVDQSITADQNVVTYSCAASNSVGPSGPVNVAIKRDGTAPTVGYTSATTAPNGNGWYDSDVTATFTATDNLSGFGNPVSSTTTGTRTTSGEGASVTVGSPAFADNAGNQAAAGAATSAGYKIDKSAPTISGAPTTSPNGAGWYNATVAVHYTCADALSGIASCDADDLLSGDGANQSASGNATDMAGNTASATVSGINIDKTAPTASASKSPAANGAGWNNADVTVSFSGSDATSGIASCSAPVTVSTETGGQAVSGTCTDVAGNASAQATATVKLDKTAPSISGSASPAANGAGWNNTNVSVSFTCNDNLSGVDTCGPNQTLSSEGTGLSATGSAADHAGNGASATVSGIKIDKTKPVVAVTGVANGATYTLGSVPAAGCTTSDALSGVATNATLGSSGGPVGSITATCSGAADNAGNTNSASVTYNVVYSWAGFFQPVDNAPTVNAVKAGSAVPVKFSLGGNQGLNIFAATYPLVSGPITCGTAVDDIETTVTAGNSSLTYDATANQYVYVWKTDKAWVNSCRSLTVKLIDGTIHQATFQFK